MSDPLVALQQAIKSRSPVTYSNASGPTPSLQSATHLHISGTSFPKSTLTRYLKPASGTDCYPLGAIYLAWLLRDAPGAEYMKQARESGLIHEFVSVTDRKNVVDWLGGAGDGRILAATTAESSTPPGSPTRAPSALHAMPGRTKSRADIAASSSATPAVTGKRPKYVPDAADVEVVKKIKSNEVELRDRNTVLRGIKANNFTSIRTAYAEKLKKMKEAGRGGVPSATTTPNPDAKLQARKARNNYPIIIISSSPTALITMYNVKRFLEEAAFEPSLEARQRNPAKPEDLLAIYRKRTTIDASGRETETNARYFVVDSVEALSKFGPDSWDRVVCVMTTGQAWQFRPYKWNDPRTLFHHVKGIYVTWANDPPNAKIKDWNVTELKIDPHRRHVDKSVVAHFWKTLDSWIMQNKPWLMKA
ncbi:RNA polymerase II accessory factor [Crucibulum laeve]|uniref:RNA polymerase II accessory factor n=1 Tax=Crucibulum laeve TaxID=68775 RepID=A0A5C3LID0_9AGAR|nr:RNA polymerase II accessory factor [Crucibulum laeve]